MSLVTAQIISGYLWLLFLAVWFISALNTKRTIRREGNFWTGYGLRLILAVIIILLLTNNATKNYFKGEHQWSVSPGTQSVMIYLGLLFLILGIAVAFWARFYLGRNWSNTPSIKQDHELVTSGPYRYIRHPIYTGIFLGIVGSILINGPIWIVALVAFLVMILFRIPIEEGFMNELFPDKYPPYKSKTKALIPFVW